MATGSPAASRRLSPSPALPASESAPNAPHPLLHSAIAQLPPSPALKPLPTPRPHSAAPLPTFELSSDEIQAITRTPLLASPVPRTRNNEPGTAAETTKAATQQPALEEQSTPLSAKDRSPLVSAEASSLRPRRLLFDDDDSNSEGTKGDEGAQQQQQRAATTIQAVWRGHCVRVLFRRACALADDLVATALAGPRRTTLEPVDLSWCFPQPLVAPPPGPESGTVAAAPAVVVPNPARAPSHTRSASATRAPTAGELTRSQRVASTAAATQPKSRGAGTNASRRDSLVRTATLPNITVTGAVPAFSSSVRATASQQQQQPRCTFQSSCRGMMSEFASSSDNLRGPPRAFVAPVQPPVRNQQQQQRASQRRPLDRSESCTSLAQLHGSRVATAMRAQRLLSETDSGGGASSFTESLRVPADARVHRPSASVTSSPKWNPF